MQEDIYLLRDLKLGLSGSTGTQQLNNTSFKSLKNTSSCMLRPSLLTFRIIPQLKLTSLSESFSLRTSEIYLVSLSTWNTSIFDSINHCFGTT